MSKIYGYVVLNKITKERFPTQKNCYNSKSAAAAGFNLITRRLGYSHNCEHVADRLGIPPELKDVKIKDQDLYAIYPLVVADE